MLEMSVHTIPHPDNLVNTVLLLDRTLASVLKLASAKTA